MHSYTFTSIYINTNTRAHKYKLIVVAYLGGDSFQIMTTGHYVSPQPPHLFKEHSWIQPQ